MSRKYPIAALAIAWVAVASVLVACGPGIDAQPSDPSPTVVSDGSSDSPASTVGAPGELPSTSTAPAADDASAEQASSDPAGGVPPEWMSRVLAAAEQESGVAATDIAVVDAEPVVWSDGSLGCPEPGHVYTQATVDGYRVELAAGDLELDYRIGADGLFVLCKQFEAPPVTVWPGDPDE